MVPGKHFSSIVFEPTTKTLFGGTYSCEIYASTDLGKTWERRDNGIGDKEIYSLASQLVDGKPRASTRAPSRRICFTATISARAGQSCRHCVKCPAWRNGHSPDRRISRT